MARCREQKRSPDVRARAYKLRDSRPGDIEYRVELALKRINKRAIEQGVMGCSTPLNEIVLLFDGCCAICGVNEIDCPTRLHLDHTHLTGKFRGWLCSQHNLLLGRLEPHLEQIMEYLE